MVNVEQLKSSVNRMSVDVVREAVLELRLDGLVTEGKTFPDNSMIVGAPARVLRPIDEKMTRMIANGADIYVRRSQQYAKGLKRIG